MTEEAHETVQVTCPPFSGLRVPLPQSSAGRAWFRPLTRPANPLRHPSSGRTGPPHSQLCCAFHPRLPPTGRSQDLERRNQARRRIGPPGRQGRASTKKRDLLPRDWSALYSAGLRPSQRGAPPVAPPRSRLHLPARRFQKPLRRGRALTPTASSRASPNRKRSALPPSLYTKRGENRWENTPQAP